MSPAAYSPLLVIPNLVSHTAPLLHSTPYPIEQLIFLLPSWGKAALPGAPKCHVGCPLQEKPTFPKGSVPLLGVP